MVRARTRRYTIRLRGRGQITIPRAVREEMAVAAGDLLTLLQLDDDLLLLTPRKLRVPALQAQFAEEMERAGVSLTDLLEGLAGEREARAQGEQENM